VKEPDSVQVMRIALRKLGMDVPDNVVVAAAERVASYYRRNRSLASFFDNVEAEICQMREKYGWPRRAWLFPCCADVYDVMEAG
jgi:hypothetical protein